jgi:hypothetical protein
MRRAPVPDIDPATLARTVCRALKRDRIEIGEWICEPVKPGFGTTTGGLYRCSGASEETGRTVPWSLILKITRPPLDAATPGAGEEITAFNYWKREALVYQSGVLDDLTGGLVAPRCFGVEEQPDGLLWLWLEDVKDRISGLWPPSQYGVAARHLGAFNAGYLTGRALPSFPWMATGWLRSWLAQFSPIVGLLSAESTWQNPIVRAALRVPIAEELQRLWAEREQFLEALDHLPRTLCHFDAWRTNLFVRLSPEGQDQTVAIDWAFAGIGAIGEEINPLVWASLTFFEIELEEARALDRLVFEGYVAGLREAGWRGDVQQARFGYVASAALRYGIPLLWGLADALDDSRHAAVEEQFGRPVAEILKRRAEGTYLLLELAEEARGLLPGIGR